MSRALRPCMVTRCICSNVTFSRVAQLAREGLSFDQITDKTGCSLSCGMCEPYVRLVIETGQSAVAVMSETEVSAVMARAKKA